MSLQVNFKISLKNRLHNCFNFREKSMENYI